MIGLIFCMLYAAASNPAILDARIHHSTSTLQPIEKSPTKHHLRWAFCPSYPKAHCSNPRWVTMDVDLMVYQQRRNHNHKSLRDIVDRSLQDMKPLSKALQRYFKQQKITSKAEQIGHVQGMIQAIQYAYDDCQSQPNAKDCQEKFSTGWAEYPKFAIEMLVDEVGDCDDAAITSTTIAQNLGFSMSFVLWPAHLSSATSRDLGDLSKVKPPKGSRLIIHPRTKKKYLHVESVGTTKGCEGGCLPLGWNKWPFGTFGQPPVTEREVVAITDKNLDSLIRLRAFRKDGNRPVFYPDQKPQDRRNTSKEEIDEELRKKEERWEERNVDRLKDLGESEEEAIKIVKKINPYQVTDYVWLLILSVAVGLVGLFFFREYKRRKVIRKLVEERKKAENDLGLD